VIFAVAFTGHTDRSRALAMCIKHAIDTLGWTHEYTASLMGLRREELDHQLAGRKPLNLWRLAELPDAFQAAYDARRAQLRGACVLEPPDLALIRGAAALGTRRMVKLTLPLGNAAASPAASPKARMA
jgi:hypothetical protein